MSPTINTINTTSKVNTIVKWINLRNNTQYILHNSRNNKQYILH